LNCNVIRSLIIESVLETWQPIVTKWSERVMR
jgi:hypothetical protein